MLQQRTFCWSYNEIYITLPPASFLPDLPDNYPRTSTNLAMQNLAPTRHQRHFRNRTSPLWSLGQIFHHHGNLCYKCGFHCSLVSRNLFLCKGQPFNSVMGWNKGIHCLCLPHGVREGSDCAGVHLWSQGHQERHLVPEETGRWTGTPGHGGCSDLQCCLEA